MSGASYDLGYLPKTRVEAFSDGVIAIIVTILVLEIKVPRLEGDRLDEQLLVALWHALPLVGAYAVSFMVLLVFWVAHHQLIHSLRRVDRNLLWLNGLFLMILALDGREFGSVTTRRGSLGGVVPAVAAFCNDP